MSGRERVKASISRGAFVFSLDIGSTYLSYEPSYLSVGHLVGELAGQSVIIS